MSGLSEIRKRLKPLRGKSTATAVAIFAADAILYTAATYGAITARSAAAALACGTGAAIATAMLFVVGHDACHGSLTAHPRVNGWIGRLAFLPSLTPFRAWDESHNRTHHVYTNLKGRDYIWAPYSPAEFARLPAWRRLLERCYRTPPGVGLYYGVEVWWKRLIFEGGADSLLCCAYAAVLILIGWKTLFVGVVCPFVGWNWLIGWAIFEHHTHPEVPWFDDETEWRSANAQARCTVHIVLPWAVDVLLHRIMQHTAHHLDVTVPLYRLHEAQAVVEQVAKPVVYRWSPLTFVRHLQMCQLYDFESRRWRRFAAAQESRNYIMASAERRSVAPPSAPSS